MGAEVDCTVPNPIEELMDDHRLIERVLEAFEKRVVSGEGGELPLGFVKEALEFFAEFADSHHHFKEESALFPAMERRGVPREGGPIGMMLHEHEIGRAALRGIRENLPKAGEGSAEAVEAIRRHAGEYVNLLRNHIWKEDNVLFRMAEAHLSPEDIQELEAEFHDPDNKRVQPEIREKYEAFVRRLNGPPVG